VFVPVDLEASFGRLTRQSMAPIATSYSGGSLPGPGKASAFAGVLQHCHKARAHVAQCHFARLGCPGPLQWGPDLQIDYWWFCMLRRHDGNVVPRRAAAAAARNYRRSEACRRVATEMEIGGPQQQSASTRATGCMSEEATAGY
jgi:hypothetical protein